MSAHEEGILKLRCEFKGPSIDNTHIKEPYNIDFSINFDEMNWKVLLPSNRYGAETYDISEPDIAPSEFRLHSYWFDTVKNMRILTQQIIVDRTNGKALHNYFETAFMLCGEREVTCKYPPSDTDPDGALYSFEGKCKELETLF